MIQDVIPVDSRQMVRVSYFSRPGEIGHDYKGLPRVPHPALVCQLFKTPQGNSLVYFSFQDPGFPFAQIAIRLHQRI